MALPVRLVALLRCAVGALVLHALSFADAPSALAADLRETPATQARSEADRLFRAVVKVQTQAVDGARTAASLGAEREGTGVVIGEGGLILTAGYLVVEADQVKIVDSRGRAFPARVIGYDHPTGLGLVQTMLPLDAQPLRFGESAALKERDPVMIVNYEGRDDVTLAFVVSRRQFTGNWEYLVEQAIFTSPPTLKWSGAALVGRDGRLLGIGSLVVRDAMTGETTLPGNMFVPIDLLKPVLDDLVKTGHRAGPARPWLGINADEVQGRLFVVRVSPEGPAAQAGIEPGDIILGVGRDGVHTQSEFYGKVWNYGAAGAEIPLRVLHDVDVREVSVRSIDRVEYFKAAATH